MNVSVNVSAVLVTRGNVDLAPIVRSLPFDDIVVWDNSQREDLGLYGRYAGIAEAKHDVIYVQDDDLLCTRTLEMVEHYEPGRVLVNWQGAYDIPFPGRGSLFDRGLPEKVFALYRQHFTADRWFTHFGCDGIFALLADTKVGDFGFEHLPHAFDEGRLSTSPGWFDDKRLLIQERANTIKTLSHADFAAVA